MTGVDHEKVSGVNASTRRTRTHQNYPAPRYSALISDYLSELGLDP